MTGSLSSPQNFHSFWDSVVNSKEDPFLKMVHLMQQFEKPPMGANGKTISEKEIVKTVLFVNSAYPWNEVIFVLQYQDLKLHIDVFEHKILEPLLPWLRATDTHHPHPHRPPG